MQAKANLSVLIFLIIAAVHGLDVKACAAVEKIQVPYEIYLTQAISNTKILPDTFPIPGHLGRSLTLTACRGEYLPATFVIRALQPIRGLTLTETDLEGKQSSIPAGAIDIRIVKCWFQSGLTLRNEGKFLIPQLLLKDDKLVRVDLDRKENYLRTLGLSVTPSFQNQAYLLISESDSKNMMQIQPRDAETLRPVDIDSGTSKQFWITVHVPEGAIPGNYEGKIRLNMPNLAPAELILKLRVLPFALQKPELRYAIYYTGRLAKDGKGSIGFAWKSPQQYYAEMLDLKAHGVEYPTLPQNNEQLFEQELKIRQKAGLPKDNLYITGLSTLNPTEPKQLEKLKANVMRWIKIAKKYGYENVYFYGIDEATGEKLKSERPAWNVVHEAGGKVFAACYKGTFEVMGDLLDLAVFPSSPDAREAEKYHKAGHQIFCYANPHVGLEEPETYRRNHGLLAWKAGYDGSMEFAYQASYGGHIWNDFDIVGRTSKTARNPVFAFPTVNGVIDTRAWEGFRAGVNDVRYVTTLRRAIARAKANRPQLAASAQKWLEEMNLDGDLDRLRAEMIDWILKLQ